MNYYILLISLVLIGLSSCNSFGSCDDDVQPIKNFISANLDQGNYEVSSVSPQRIHQVSFELLMDRNMCSVGYRSSDSTNVYAIDLLDQNENIIWTEELSFSTNQIEYKKVENTPLKSGERYTLRRTSLEMESAKWNGYVFQAANQPFGMSTLDLPIITDSVIIHAVDFSEGIERPNNGLPYLDIGLDEN